MIRRTLIVLMLLLAACSNGAGGERSAEITVYSGRSKDLVGPIIDAFTAASGVKVNARYGDTAELATQILDEGKNSPADVFFAQDAGALGALENAGLFAALPSPILDRVPPKYRSTTGSWVGASGRVRVLAFNPTLVEVVELPATVDGLTDPRWEGKVGWAPTNGSFQAFITAFRRVKGEAAAKEWLTAMKANGAKPYKDNDSIAEAIAQGEIPVGLVNHYYPFEVRAENPDAKIEAHYFTGGDVGGLVNVAGVGVLKTANNSPGAQDFVEYLLSAAGQEAFVEQVDEYPLVAGIGAPQLKSLADLQPPSIDLSDLADLAGTLALLKDVGLV